MLRKILIFFLAFVSFIYVNAQDSTKGNLTINGSVDAYYRYNFHNAKDSGRTNNYTSFTNSQNSFELGMASVKADYAIGKVDGVVDLGFGRRAQEFSYNDEGAMAAIKQAYVSFAPSDKVKFTMGKWATHVGYELLDAYLNRNYSMDYMFSYGPFFHTGLKMDVTANKNFAFMVGVSNPNDMTTASFSSKFFLGQVHFTSTNAKVNAYVNYVGGKDASESVTNQVDAVVTGTISSKFTVGYNGTVKLSKPEGKSSSDSWWGSAVYLNFDPSSVFGLTARAEYFDDEDGVAGFYNKIFDVTLSGNIHFGNLTIIPEFRVDSGKEPLFYKNEDTDLPTAKSTGSFILAATYHF
ncbi:MAG TPA: outer membrane beta-barrel protein [Chitinophagaceae bacterium]|jgi:putative OmpL-like beta-barrel porin-2|nr:outer membrane beta-barrel protein [Chitinophagaceae bacterium]